MRLAVIGLGFMGSVHLKALADLPEVDVAVVARDKSKTTAGNLGPVEAVDLSHVKKFPGIEAALADPEIDAVDLCLPTDLHESVTLEALRRGKHVLVEKPMALDRAACNRMIDEARRANRILMVAHVLRFFPAYRALESALSQAGEIRSATFRRRCALPTWATWQSDAKKSGGAVLDLLIHDLDMALHLFGPPSSVAATGRQDLANGIDIISAQLSYDGFTVDIVGGWHSGKFPLTMKYRVIGANATLTYDLNSRPPQIHRAGQSEDLPLSSTGGYTDEIAYFIECVRSGAQPAKCPPEESARAVSLALTLMESRARNGETIPWKSE